MLLLLYQSSEHERWFRNYLFCLILLALNKAEEKLASRVSLLNYLILVVKWFQFSYVTLARFQASELSIF